MGLRREDYRMAVWQRIVLIAAKSHSQKFQAPKHKSQINLKDLNSKRLNLSLFKSQIGHICNDPRKYYR